MSGQRRPIGWAALVGVLCAAVLFGLSLTMSTATMAGVAHSERGPSTYSVSTSTASPSGTPTPDPEPAAIASPRGSSRGLPAAPLATVSGPQAVVSGVVRQGAFCARAAVAQIGSTSSGTRMICSYGEGEDQPRWRAISVEQPGPTTKKSSPAKPTDEEQSDDESTTEGPTTTAKPPSSKPADASSENSAVPAANRVQAAPVQVPAPL